MATINVTLLPDGKLRVDPNQNPLEVSDGDGVSWNFVPEIHNPRVEFKVFLPADGSEPVMGPGNNPFGNPIPPIGGPNIVLGTARRGLYHYSVFSDNVLLHWEVPLFIAGSFEANFGGIVKPKGPP